MSYILQALKRAEEDRRAAAARSLPARPLPPPAAPPRDPAIADTRAATPIRRSLRVWAVAVGVGVAVNALGFGAVFVLSRPSSVAVVAPSPAGGEKAEAPAAPAPPVPVPPVQRPATEAPPVQPPAAEARPSPSTPPAAPTPVRPQEAERQPQGEAVAMAPRTGTTPVIVPPPLVPVRPLPPPQVPPRVPAPAIAPESRPERLQGKASRLRDLFRSGGEMERNGESYELEQMDAAKEELPGDVTKLRIEVLVWAVEPEKRMIYVAGRKYVEGDAIEKGTVIEQIARDGVVLIHQGQRIRVPSVAR